MPVVVLRRILSHLVLKKRASANRADAAAWHLDDLLFISAFGDEATDQREIAFAHFHQEAGDLPTLRVLGWDGADTAAQAGLRGQHAAGTAALARRPQPMRTPGASSGRAPSATAWATSSAPPTRWPSGWPSWRAASATPPRPL